VKSASRRARQASFILVMGVVGAGATWLAAALGPGEMLCIEAKVLWRVGLLTSAGAGLFGELLSRIPPAWLRLGLEAVARLLRRH
jgi:hypothetical protein